MPLDLISFVVFASAMVATPGPANMVLLTAGARFGLRRALPFVAGVAIGKQFVIWPVGLGMLGVVAQVPMLFAAMKWASAAYIVYLAIRIAGARITPASADDGVPGFAGGLVVHPLNPKAWAMVTTAFGSFVQAGQPPLWATAWVAGAFLAIQCVLHPLWCLGGAWMARTVAGTRIERGLMIGLAALTIASVAIVLIGGA